jgi:Holliday junction resolvase RusA-like endonuclease
MPTVILQLPIPANCLRPNGRGSAFVRRQVVRFHRLAAIVDAHRALDDAGLLSNGRGPKWESATYKLRVFYPHQEPDEDNIIASIKSYLDGIQDAGVIANDKGLRIAGVTRQKCEDGMPRVEIEITETQKQ